MPLEPIVLTSAFLPEGHLSREEIEVFQQFLSHLYTSSIAPTSSFAVSTSGTSASTLFASISPSQDSWIIDSGASYHMTGISFLFKSYNVSSSKDKVRIVDGTYSFIAAGHGDIIATPYCYPQFFMCLILH